MKTSSFLVYQKLLNALFFNHNNETIEHLFWHCFVPKALWNDLNTCFENHLSLYDLTPQGASFGFREKDLDDTILQNHLPLVFKIYLYSINHDLVDLFA